MEEITIPQQHWYSASQRLALMNLTSQKRAEVVSVPVFEHSGYAYMGNSAIYTAFGSDEKSSIGAYRLIPKSLFKGETTTVYHDPEAINRGERERGNLVGLIVSVKKQLMVCSTMVKFVASLPTTAPISLSEAKKHAASFQSIGWRKSVLDAVTPLWNHINGHPVASYNNPDMNFCCHVLFWRLQNEVHEMSLGQSVIFDDDCSALNSTPWPTSGSQMQLF